MNRALTMLDLNPQKVEILIREDGKVVWINVDDLCRLRATMQPDGHVIVRDERTSS